MIRMPKVHEQRVRFAALRDQDCYFGITLRTGEAVMTSSREAANVAIGRNGSARSNVGLSVAEVVQ